MLLLPPRPVLALESEASEELLTVAGGLLPPALAVAPLPLALAPLVDEALGECPLVSFLAGLTAALVEELVPVLLLVLVLSLIHI